MKLLNNNIFLLIIIFAIIVVFISLKKINNTEESFNPLSALENPGSWIGTQIGGVWASVKAPLEFARSTTFDVMPNYTWVTRYYDKKNDWVRANKGMPPLSPSPTANVAKMTLDYNDKNYNLSTGRYKQSMLDLIT